MNEIIGFIGFIAILGLIAFAAYQFSHGHNTKQKPAH